MYQFLSGENVETSNLTEDLQIETTNFIELTSQFDDSLIALQSLQQEEKSKAMTADSESDKLYEILIEGMTQLNYQSIENFILILSVTDETFNTEKMKDDVIPHFKSKNVQDVTTKEHKEKLIQILNNKEYRNYKWKEQHSIQL